METLKPKVSKEDTKFSIQLIHVEVSYTPGEVVLRIPQWSLAKGEKHFLYGSSGSGKSTLLSVLSGIIPPNSGSVIIEGTNLTELSTGEKDRFRGDNIGYIFQQFNLIPYLSVWENIYLPLSWNKKRRTRIRFSSIQEEIQHLAESLLIDAILDKKASKISVGQAQRVAVARALLGSPPLILADEPTSALDEEAKREFLTLLFKLVGEEGSTLLFVSHDKTLMPLFDRSTNLKEIQS